LLFGTQNTVPYSQKYALTDCFFGDFAHWVKTPFVSWVIVLIFLS